MLLLFVFVMRKLPGTAGVVHVVFSLTGGDQGEEQLPLTAFYPKLITRIWKGIMVRI